MGKIAMTRQATAQVLGSDNGAKNEYYGVMAIDALYETPMAGSAIGYLEGLRGYTAKEEIYVALKCLAKVIVFAKRPFEESEKAYFFEYVREAYDNGIDVYAAGIDDRVLARLTTRQGYNDLGQMELDVLLDRYREIAEFAMTFDEKYGFYEETAAKHITFDVTQVKRLVERCLYLARMQERPRGTVFALALLHLGQYKSAAEILLALAKKGQATEFVGYLQRFLTAGEGAEKVAMHILRLNLYQLRLNGKESLHPVYGLYVVQQYMLAARVFAENQFYKESAGVLQELTVGKWFNGFQLPKREFGCAVNFLLGRNPSLSEGLALALKRLGLQVIEENGHVYAGERGEVLPEASWSGEDVVLERQEAILASLRERWDALREVMMAEAEDGKARQQEAGTGALDDFVGHEFYSFSSANNDNSDEVVEYEPENDEDNTVHNQEKYINNNKIDDKSDVTDDKIEDILQHFNNADLSVQAVAVPSVSNELKPSSSDIISGILSAHDAEALGVTDLRPADDHVRLKSVSLTPAFIDEEKPSSQSNKININSILNISSKDIDEHFERIKQVTSSVFKRAGEKSADGSFMKSTAVDKVRQFAGKLFGKK